MLTVTRSDKDIDDCNTKDDNGDADIGWGDDGHGADDGGYGGDDSGYGKMVIVKVLVVESDSCDDNSSGSG